MRKIKLIDLPQKDIVIYRGILTKKFWQNRLKDILKLPVFADQKGIINKLAEINPYYDTRKGMYDFSNARAGRSGLEKTAKVALDLEKYLNQTYNDTDT